MNLKKRQTLTYKVCIAWMIALVLSNLVIGTLSYMLYRNQLLDARAMEAQNVAMAMAVRIDGEKFTDIMDTLEKNDYWHEVKAYADRIAIVFDTAYIYILDNDYTDEVTYFAEGAPGDAPFDLGTTELIEDVYADEMFETIRTGEPSFTEPYPSGEYGNMVSGFAAITDKNGNVAGVVGVDFLYGDIESRLAAFALTIGAIITVFVVALFFLMFYLGNLLAGKPLTKLDYAAQQFALGDMDIDLDIKSSTEIGRLAGSFTRMIDAMKSEVAALERLSQGDLTPQVEPRGEKDTMGLAIARILDNLNEMFREIRQAASSVSMGARQMSDSAQILSQGTTSQSEAVERLSASISEVSSKANENLAVAAKTNTLAGTIKSDAQTGAENMDRMTNAVKEITDASMSINKVIKVIDDIAFQTNILALNAAVEAARAGQHGKGFAVVAEEVRNLASKSAEAAKDTERLIVNSMEKAQLGASIADETVESLDRIIAGINECAELVDVIAGSFEEQIGSISQINQEIEQVSNVVHQNSATAEESAAASEEMSGQAETLEGLVARFKLRGQ